MRKSVVLLALGSLLATAAAGQSPAEAPSGDWPRYARDDWGTRYSPLDEINTQTVQNLQESWRFTLRPEGGAGLLGGTVPIVIDGTMFVPLGNAIVALEAHTGRELWRHAVTDGLVRRGVSYWPGDEGLDARIYYSTGQGLRALSAATGEVETAFGNGGEITFQGTGYSYPPSIFGNVMVIGANTPEDPIGPSGNTRAFDAVSGEKLWEFNSVPRPGEVGHESWLDDGWDGVSGANMWIWYTTADVEAGLVYMTLGSPSPNYYGGERPGANLFGNSLVAVDMQTGEYRWHFQTIHHDLWDWDLPAPPVLLVAEVEGTKSPPSPLPASRA